MRGESKLKQQWNFVKSFVFTWYFQCGNVYSRHRFSRQTRNVNNYQFRRCADSLFSLHINISLQP